MNEPLTGEALDRLVALTNIHHVDALGVGVLDVTPWWQRLLAQAREVDALQQHLELARAALDAAGAPHPGDTSSLSLAGRVRQWHAATVAERNGLRRQLAKAQEQVGMMERALGEALGTPGQDWDLLIQDVGNVCASRDAAERELAEVEAKLAEARRLRQSEYDAKVRILEELFEAFGNNGLARTWKEQIDDLRRQLAEKDQHLLILAKAVLDRQATIEHGRVCRARGCEWPGWVVDKASHQAALPVARAVEAGEKGAPTATERPTVVCLCGSTRFLDAFFEAGWQETLAGKIVLSIGVCKHGDAQGGHGAEMLGPDVAAALDELHLRKIDLADEVYILNVGGYIGQSTRSELEYALAHGKPVRYLEPLPPNEEAPDGQDAA